MQLHYLETVLRHRKKERDREMQREGETHTHTQRKTQRERRERERFSRWDQSAFSLGLIPPTAKAIAL